MRRSLSLQFYGVVVVLGLCGSPDSVADEDEPLKLNTRQRTSSGVETIQHNKQTYRVLNISLQTHHIGLSSSPSALVVADSAKEKNPIAMMNAGMYHVDHRPVGLQIVEGVQTVPINLNKGKGNFFLLPNGVFAIDDQNQPHIVSSTTFDASEKWRLATQSGPLLLLDGVYHPALAPTSSNVHIRNGVCISDTQVHWIISIEPVRFYDLASLMRERLHCRDGLYLDGAISKLYFQVNGQWNEPISAEELGSWLVLYPKK